MEQRDRLYFGKLSEEYPQQLEKNFYAGGKEGSDWYNGIQRGDMVFAIYKGAIHKLWRVREYTWETFKMESDGSVLFDVVRTYDPPVPLMNVFLLCKHFVLDLNLVNKSAKQTSRGFYPIRLINPSIDPARIEFNSEKRRIIIGEHGGQGELFKFNDWDILLNVISDYELTLEDIWIQRAGLLYEYSAMQELYMKKSKGDRFRLRALLLHAQQNGNIKKIDYLRNVINALEKARYYEVTSPVSLYDCIIAGPSTISTRKRYWAGGVLWGNTDKTDDFVKGGYFEIGFEADDPAGTRYYDRLMQIKPNDRFLLKRWGGYPQLRVLAVGTVTDVSEAADGTIGIEWDQGEKWFEGEAPSGPGAGVWRHTLIEVRREDIIIKLFKEDLGEDEDADIIIDAGESFEGPSKIPPVNTAETGVPGGDEANGLPPDNRLEIFPGGTSIRSENVEPMMGVLKVAEEVAEMLKNTRDEPATMIGIFGRWGRGKTYFVRQLWKKLESTPLNEFIRIDFHAWKYQDTPASWAYLYETLAEAYFTGGNMYPSEDGAKTSLPLQRFWKRVKLNWQRVKGWDLLVLLLLVSSGVTWIVLSAKGLFDSAVQSIALPAAWLGIFGSIVLFIKKYQTQAIDLFQKYTRKHSFSPLLGMQAEIQKELRTLLKVWIKETEITDTVIGTAKKQPEKRILLFIDDIDRCKEDRIIEIVDSLRVMLEDKEIWKRVVVLAAVDERILKRAIRWKYTHLLKAEELDGQLEILTREYVDKLFLLGIKLGELSESEKVEFYNGLTKGKVERRFITGPEVIAAEDEVELDEEDEYAEEEGDDEVVIIENKEGRELSFSNSEQLLQSIKDFDEITPRQIRITYYRYLLALRLMYRKLEGDQRLLYKFKALDNAFIPELLRAITDRTGEDKFQEFRNTAQQAENGQVIIELGNRQFTVDKRLWEVIIRTLEIVVAY